MTNAISELTEWLKREPNATEVIIIRRRDDVFSVKIEYGSRTTVPHENTDLSVALSNAVRRADANPSWKRATSEKTTAEKKLTKVKLPGLP